MIYQININEDSYKKLKASLMLTGEDEEVVLERLINQYAHATFEKAMEKNTPEVKTQQAIAQTTSMTNIEQKQAFVNWFRSLKRKNGDHYNLVTISGYAGRIEKACSNPAFASIPVDNLFNIVDLDKFIIIQKQIKNCPGYAEFDEKSHNGFTAALRKYEEFLRFQVGGESLGTVSPAFQARFEPPNNHRWTLEEDTICCRRFLEYYVIQQKNTNIEQFLQMLEKEVPEIPVGSLRMKLQNIKYLSTQAGLKDTFYIKGLNQYSKQCYAAFNQELLRLGLK